MSSSLTDNYSDGEPSKTVLQTSCLTDEWRSHHSGTNAEVRLAFIRRLRFIAALLSRFFSTPPQQTLTRAGRAHGMFERFS
jgi:hypothetical protein